MVNEVSGSDQPNGNGDDTGDEHQPDDASLDGLLPAAPPLRIVSAVRAGALYMRHVCPIMGSPITPADETAGLRQCACRPYRRVDFDTSPSVTHSESNMSFALLIAMRPAGKFFYARPRSALSCCHWRNHCANHGRSAASGMMLVTVSWKYDVRFSGRGWVRNRCTLLSRSASFTSMASGGACRSRAR